MITITPSVNLIRSHHFHEIKNNMGANREARIREISMRLVKTTRTSHELQGWVTREALFAHRAMRDFTPITAGGFKESYLGQIIAEQE